MKRQRIRWKLTALFMLLPLLLGACGAGQEKITDHTGVTETAKETETVKETETEQEEAEVPDEAAGDYEGGSVYRILEDYPVPGYGEYGTTETVHMNFVNVEDQEYYYYEVDEFYFYADYPEVLNQTLEQYYEQYKEECMETAALYENEDYGENEPYSKLIFLNFTYGREDYMSLLFNRVEYMGGAHPESSFDGLVISCDTGEIVPFTEFTDGTEEEIWQEVSGFLGMDGVCSNADADYFLTDEEVVFFYRIPQFWPYAARKRDR